MKKNTTIGFILNCILNLLIVIFTIFLLISIYTTFQIKILKNDYANFFGYSLFEIQTGSMHGTLEVGDWIVVKNTQDYKIGDIVTYKSEGNFITHRIVEAYNETFVTKGDANNTKDEAIDKSQIVGKVTKQYHGFGILRKTIFNPFVIIVLLVTFYLFNKTFKNESKGKKVIINKPKEKKDQTIKSVRVSSPELKQIEEEEIKIVKKLIKEEELNKTAAYKLSANKQVGEASKVSEAKKSEEDLSKTAMFRYISVDKPAHEVPKVTQPKNKEEDLSKTAMFRIISVNTNDVKESKNIKPKKEIKAEIIEKKEEVKGVKEILLNRFQNKKSINIVDKYFYIKKIAIDEILNVLLENEKKYIIKSTLRKQFVEFYINEKYFSTDQERKNIKKILANYKDKLLEENVRNENKVLTINAYYNAMTFISTIEESKNIKVDINKSKYKIDASKIEEIINISNNYINGLVEKLDSPAFELKTNKIIGQKNMYGVYLNHNLNFSKVYSNYIVDKTYNEGIINEDKLAVLINLILVNIVKNLINGEFKNRYILYIPSTLYQKDKKLDKILSKINDKYSNNHIYILSTLSNMLNNKDDFIRLRKKGYLFALSFDKTIKLKGDDVGYIEMCDLFFIDTRLQTPDLYESIPSSITNSLIKDNINKKTGNTGGE